MKRRGLRDECLRMLGSGEELTPTQVWGAIGEGRMRSTVTNTLDRLERAGLLSSRFATEVTGRGSRHRWFKITGEGVRELQVIEMRERLAEAPTGARLVVVKR